MYHALWDWGTQRALRYISTLGAFCLLHWLIPIAPSCLQSRNARYIMLKSLKTYPIPFHEVHKWIVCFIFQVWPMLYVIYGCHTICNVMMQLISDSTNPLLEYMLTYHQRCTMTFTRRAISQELLMTIVRNMYSEITHLNLPSTNELTLHKVMIQQQVW